MFHALLLISEIDFMSAEETIKKLDLIRHEEGGWFKETYRSPEEIDCPDREGGKRSLLTTIHYMLDQERPHGLLHRNKSPIIHFYEGGGLLRYVTVSPEGELSETLLGESHERQLTVPGGFWKASELLSGDYGLVGEAVSPGFDYRDWEIANRDEIAKLYPEHIEALKPFLP